MRSRVMRFAQRTSTLYRASFPVLPTVLVAMLSAACASTQTVSRPALHSVAIERQASFTPAEQALLDAHCPEGAPQVVAKPAIGPTQFVIRTGYVLEHSAVNKIPVWVCEAVT